MKVEKGKVRASETGRVWLNSHLLFFNRRVDPVASALQAATISEP
jgi:hypothetical protein